MHFINVFCNETAFLRVTDILVQKNENEVAAPSQPVACCDEKIQRTVPGVPANLSEPQTGPKTAF
jgi:hypothetical protein